MNKLAPWSLLIALLALLFGGVFSNVWQDWFDSAHVTSSVSSISIITRDTSEQEIELDPEMVFESRQIPLFPTLKSTQGLNELRAMISEYDQRQHAIVIAELRKFQSIAGAGSTPGDLTRISQVSSIFSAARRRFCYKNHEVVAYMERRIWHTRWVNRNRGAFGSFLTVD